MLIWPAGGIGLAAFLLTPKRLWLALTAAFYISGITADMLLAHRSFMTSAGYMTGNMIESISCAWIILHWAGDFKNFTQVKEILALIVGTVFVNAFSSCIGAGTAILTREISFIESWQSWFIADGLGILVVGPFILTWLTIKHDITFLRSMKIWEAVAFTTIWIIVTWLIFHPNVVNNQFIIHPYVLVAFLAWPALRLNQRCLTLALMLLFVIAIFSPSIVTGPSPWGGDDIDLSHRLLDLQLFMGFMAVVGYLLAVGHADRELAEDALRESEERYRSLIENMENGFADHLIILDDHGKPVDFLYLEINDSYEHLTGFTREQVIGKRESEISPKFREERFDWLGVYGQVALGGESVRFEAFSEELGKWFSVSSYRSGPGHFVTNFFDITERKRAEEELRSSEEKYRVLFKNEIYAICIFDLETLKLLDVNEAYTSLYGYNREELITGMTVHDITAEQNVSDAATAQAKREGTIYIPLRYHRKKDGTVFPVEIVGGPYEWKERKVMFALAHDITERKIVESEKEKLEAQNRQLHKEASLTRMAGAIAHNFNNMLAVVMGNLELTIDNQYLDKGSIENLTEAMKAARRASEVSGQMLEYLGQSIGKRELMNLTEVCRTQLPKLMAALPKNVVLKADLSSSEMMIFANMNQMQQVITNLVSNAGESMGDDEGTIHMSVETVDSAEISEAYRFPVDFQPVSNTYICLEVEDLGCGIPAKDIENIFDPFFSTKFTGRGLSLPVVLGIIRAHNGVITVESEPGKGSVFRVFLSQYGEMAPKHHAKPIPISEYIGKGTVMLIDDEEAVRKMTSMILTRMGFTVLLAKDGLDAVEIFSERKNEINCVICDLTMPRMNGWETIAALRKLAPDIPVILSSGYDESGVMASEHSEKPQAFLGKPYQLIELRNAIQLAIR